MLGLIVRILILCAVVFGVVYAFTRARRAAADSKEAQRIAEEIRALRASLERGETDSAEYVALVNRIRADCARLGIPVPDLPSQLPERDPKAN